MMWSTESINERQFFLAFIFDDYVVDYTSENFGQASSSSLEDGNVSRGIEKAETSRSWEKKDKLEPKKNFAWEKK